MTKNTSITLGDHFDAFISSQLASGRYSSASEIVRAGLRLLEDSESKLQALRQMLIQGEESAIADYNYQDFLSVDFPQIGAVKRQKSGGTTGHGEANC